MPISTMVDAIDVRTATQVIPVKLLVLHEETPGNPVRIRYLLSSGRDCDQVDDQTWRCRLTGELYRRINAERKTQ